MISGAVINCDDEVTNSPPISQIIAEQVCFKKELEICRTSYIKLARDKRTKGVIIGKIEMIKAVWNNFCKNNRIIEINSTDEDRQRRYFAENVFATVETLYSNFFGELNDALDKFRSTVIDDGLNVNTATTQPSTSELIDNPLSVPVPSSIQLSTLKLPRVEIPKFSGCYTEWQSFSDLFLTLIHDNVNIPRVQKLYFLKTNVIGDAARLIKHLDVCERNYETAWHLLEQRYDNKRVIVNNYLQILTTQPVIHDESSEALKKMLDTTNECLHSLRNLEIEVDKWDAMLIYLLIQKLPMESRNLWERSLTNAKDIPTIDELLKFLDIRFHNLEMVRSDFSQSRHDGSGFRRETRFSHIRQSFSCPLCSKGHSLRQCEKFMNMNSQARKNFVLSKPICKNCLALSHPTQGCNNPRSCFHCGERHHSLLHGAFQGSPAQLVQQRVNTRQQVPECQAENRLTSLHHYPAPTPSDLLLATALVKVETETGVHILRALIDSGSQGSFITEESVQRCQLQKNKTAIKISGIGKSVSEVCSAQVVIPVKSLINQFSCHIIAYVLKSLTNLQPTRTFRSSSSWSHLNDIILADPTYNIPGKIDILLGIDVYTQILMNGLKRGIKESPIAQNTQLGWILFGDINSADHRKAQPELKITVCHSSLQTDELLRRFWELENIEDNRTLTQEERDCEEFFERTHRRLSDGRYEVKLPFVNFQRPELGESRNAALSRLYGLERTIGKRPEVFKQYAQCINEYSELSHMRPAVNTDHIFRTKEGTKCYGVYYLPHHAVFKESSTTSLRVVFDASNKTTNGISLNDKLIAGPRLQDDLISIILRWRQYPVVFMADISKMYRQIRVAEEDIPYQRILWRNTPQEPVCEFELQTVTFGTSCAPYLAIRTLRQLAVDESNNFPLAHPIVLRDFYVDDVMSGADTEDEAIQTQQQLQGMLANGGFVLRKWASNNKQVLKNIPRDERETHTLCTLNDDGLIKALGLYWNPIQDCFSFKVHIKDKNSSLTKRSLLSQIAQLFDPIGWLTPIIITAKIMMQQLWLVGIDWDDPVPVPLTLQWNQLKKDLKGLECLNIPRWLNFRKSYTSIQLHGFCDASMVAYCAAVYTRVICQDGDVKVALLTAKSKVAPLKPVTLPRLELCGAVLLVNLLQKVRNALTVDKPEVFAWSDSMITLSWIRGRPTQWKSFVCNRVAAIQEQIDCKAWRYVNTHDNPADLGSRGCQPTTLIKSSLWWNGPTWLTLPEADWPIKFASTTSIDTEHEKRITIHYVETNPVIAIQEFSTLSRLLRVTSLCLRFIHTCRQRRHALTQMARADGIRMALNFLIKAAQKDTFPEELESLNAQQPISPKSKVMSLNPFICDKGLLRVGGRLQHANLNYNATYPIILPTNHHLTHLIIRQAHLLTLHGGPQLTAAYLRCTYWIPQSRNIIRQIIHKCITCFKYKKTRSFQLMGNLPEPRVKPSRAFTHTGVDYAGPINVRMSKGRRAKFFKGYIAVFICLCTKAIHLELVSDQSTQAFLAALKRFTSRRGLCSDIYSDCGTNFIGANRIMQNELKHVIQKAQEEAATLMSIRGIKWHFIPPASPHFGGLWEAGVKSLKYHLRRVIGETSLTFEELMTVLTQIEACLNSRPLCPMSNDINDLSVLTPGHFLIGECILAPPEPNYLDLNQHTLSRWQYLQQIVQQLWKRWSREYLSRLQERPKWTKPQKNVQIGNLVLIKNERLPPTQWLLGRIEEVFLGDDGMIRVVAIKTKAGILKRTITKIALLPIPENNISQN